jgi:hypothetical protein
MIWAGPGGEHVAATCSMRAMLRSLVIAGVILSGALMPSAASAVTLDEITGLARAGVTDAIILALIDRDKTVFAIESAQILQLQRDGLSEAVILALLKSGRDEGDQAARADAASNAAWIMASMPTEPLLVFVGHGPDSPNVAHPDGFYSGPPAYFPSFGAGYAPSFSSAYAPSFSSAYAPSFGASRRSSGSRSSGTSRFDTPRQMCVAQVNTARSTRALSYVTVCPEVMQPRRLR